jgi:cytochrome d ubiquinol oxidase subunit II
MDYPIIWGVLISVALLVYMILDGFDLGVGILFPFGGSSHERENMMNSIAPIWDTNETWLILAAGGLYGVFPKAYVFIFNALYIPLISMLICLIFRGVSFEFRFKSPERFKFIWSICFFVGSLGMSLFQGVILGQLILGFPAVDGQFNGDYWAWFSPYNFVISGLVVVFYAFMGANFLIYRFKDASRLRFVHISKVLLGLVVAYIASLVIGFIYMRSNPSAFKIVSLPHHAERFGVYYYYYLALFVVVGFVAWRLYQALGKNSTCDALPFLYGTLGFVLVYAGVIFLGWPYIVPGALTIWEASSLPETQRLIFIGASFFLPLILGYSFYNFYIFRGKVSDQTFYH